MSERDIVNEILKNDASVDTNLAVRDAGVPTVKNPEAPNTQEFCPGYKLINVQESLDGISGDLVLAGEPANIYGKDINKLKLKVEYQNENRIKVEILPAEITDETSFWYLVPEEVLPTGKKEKADFHSKLKFEYSEGPSFWFSVSRLDTCEVLFSTKGYDLVFEDQFIEFRASMEKGHYIYGLGEIMGDFRIAPGSVRTMYNADIGDTIGANLYGTHPFYIEERFKSGTAHGVYLRNAHAQEVLVKETELIWRALGGTVDLYFFAGPTAKDVIKQYQGVIGFPAMHQYWTLGLHQCRWGYKNIADLCDVVNTHREHGIPLETIWSDIDYMEKYRDFTLDPVNYPKKEFGRFLETLHAKGQKYVPIIDAAIYAPKKEEEADYKPFVRGVEADAFIRNPDGSLYIGKVWPGNTVFPDWLESRATAWWTDELEILYKDLKYDGIWLDMNEVASFVEGSAGKKDVSEYDAGGRNIARPPYTINTWQKPNTLEGHSISTIALHAGDVTEYDFHNLWGYQHSIATYKALEKIQPGKRPFVISRSTFAGSGKWAGHWGGDNWSEWKYLRYSISQALTFSMFGMPMFGVDVGGFSGDTTPELMSRWAQLGAFFTFYRNHNAKKSIGQEFYQWPEVESAAKTALHIRYLLLPYFYTLLQQAHSFGETVIRALVWEFPGITTADIDSQFMVGPSLLVIPVLEKGASSVKGIFPGQDTTWYDWYTHARVEQPSNRNVSINAPLGHIPVYIRGGSILPLQQPGYTTADSRNGEWYLIAALDLEGKASGELYVDDGESIKSPTKTIGLSVANGKLISNVSGDFQIQQNLVQITVLGITTSPTDVKWNGKASHFKYDDDIQSLKIFNAGETASELQALNENLHIEWV